MIRGLLRATGIALLLTIGGCRGAAPASSAQAAAAGHEHHAPHQGQLIELGEEFGHVELVLDAKAGTMTAYVLDGEAEQAVRVEQPSITITCTEPVALAHAPLGLEPAANVLTGETVGDASEFTGAHPALRGAPYIDGQIAQITMKGHAFHDLPFRATAVP